MTQSLKRGSPYTSKFSALFASCGNKEFRMYAGDMAVREALDSPLERRKHNEEGAGEILSNQSNLKLNLRDNWVSSLIPLKSLQFR